MQQYSDIVATGFAGNRSAFEAWSNAFKTADTTRTATTVVANDPTLQFAVAANTAYAFRIAVFFTTTANGDFKYQLTGPASPSLVRLYRRAVVGGASTPTLYVLDTAFVATDQALAGAGAEGWFECTGVLVNGVNAGTVAFAWAQNTSDAGNTIVRRGSFIEFRVV